MLKRNKMVKRSQKKEGQSTVEYVVLVSAVLGAVILFLTPGGVFRKTTNQTFTDMSKGVNTMSDRVANSWQ